jgi:hypothetical protein
MSKRPGLWANIHAKRKRGERMRKKGAKGAPTQAQMDKARASSEEMTTAADAGIPHDTKDIGPRFTTTNVLDRRRKKKPALLKRFTKFITDD